MELELLKRALIDAINRSLDRRFAEMTEQLKLDIADEIIDMIKSECRDADTYHNLIGLLNTIRLQEEEDDDKLEREIRSDP
jgi:hypothetical protein